MSKSRNIEHFDPSEQQTEELLPPTHTDEVAFVSDTIADPEGAEVRDNVVTLPDYFYNSYTLDSQGNPTFRPDRVDAIMVIFDKKCNSDNTHYDATEYEQLVHTLVCATSELLFVDPQTTGINRLQEATRTWAEFVSVAFEHHEASVRQAERKPDDPTPDWLIEREQKAFDLGKKARLLRDVNLAVDDKYGLRSVKLDRARVRTEVERRQQRLAEWNYNNCLESSLAKKVTYNAETAKHNATMLDNF